jgi:hypothetical protein
MKSLSFEGLTQMLCKKPPKKKKNKKKLVL